MVYALGIGFPEFVWVGTSFSSQPTSNSPEVPVICGKLIERMNRLLGSFLNKGVEDFSGYQLPRIWVVLVEGLFEGIPVRGGSCELG